MKAKELHYDLPDIYVSGREIRIENCNPPHFQKFTIRWRDKIIHVRFHAFIKELGYKFTEHYLCDGAYYEVGAERYKYMAGSTGCFPGIVSDNFILKRRLAPGVVVLYEECLDETTSHYDEFPGFEITRTPEYVLFDVKESAKINTEYPFNPNQVILYRKRESERFVESCAYFRTNDLIIDYWYVHNYIEKEQTLVIPSESLLKVYQELKVENGKKSELLVALQQLFYGELSFHLAADFLKQKEVFYISNEHTENLSSDVISYVKDTRPEMKKRMLLVWEDLIGQLDSHLQEVRKYGGTMGQKVGGFIKSEIERMDHFKKHL